MISLAGFFFLKHHHLYRTLKNEYDDLHSKSLDAEKELKLVEMKVKDTSDSIMKLQKDMDCKLQTIFRCSIVNNSFYIIYFSKTTQKLLSIGPLLDC